MMRTTRQPSMAELDQAVQHLVEYLVSLQTGAFPNVFRAQWSHRDSTKYARVMMNSAVYCFIRTAPPDEKHLHPIGTIWKPKGWKGPALNVPRGNVFDPDSYKPWLGPHGIAQARRTNS